MGGDPVDQSDAAVPVATCSLGQVLHKLIRPTDNEVSGCRSPWAGTQVTRARKWLPLGGSEARRTGMIPKRLDANRE